MATANDSVFMHPAFTWVKDEITRRERIYGSRVRAGKLSGKDHNTFLAGKTAWAGIKTESGQLLIGSAHGGFQSLYSGTKNKDGTQNTDSGKIIPRPGLTSVSVRHDGEYGTLQRATVNFKVFSLEQLDQIECEVLVVGQPVKIQYGWSVDVIGGKKDPNSGEFNGITYNFSYSLNKEGGFDCSFDAVGEGYFTLGTNPNMVASDETVTAKSSEGVAESTFTGFGYIANNIKTRLEKDDAFKIHGTNDEGMYAFQLNLKAINPADEEEDAGDKMQWYISLEKLVELINSEIKKQVNNKTTFVCNSATTLGERDPWIKSPAIQHIIFPGKRQGDYTDEELKKLPEDNVTGVGFGEIAAGFDAESKPTPENMPDVEPEVLKFNKELFPYIAKKTWDTGDHLKSNEVNLAATLININTLQSIQNSLTSKRNDVATVKDLLTGIFNLIAECSGGIYDLTIIPTEDEDTQITNNLIVNKNHTKFTHASIKPDIVVFKPFGTSSVVRDMTLSAQIPDALATQAYVATRGGGNGAQSTSYPKPVTGLFTNQCGAKTTTPLDLSRPASNDILDITSGGEGGFTEFTPTEQKEAQAIDKANALIAQKLQNYIQILFGYYKYTRIELEMDTQFSHELLGEQSSVSAALNTYKTLGDENLTRWNKNIMLPLKFGVTIDGINGFKFGDTIATTYIPKKYKTDIGGFKAVFTVTKVNHSIQNNDWTTTLETVCRLSV